MAVKFIRNGTVHEVDSEVAGALLTATIAAMCDARDGLDIGKSPAYHEFQALMSKHVYGPKAPHHQEPAQAGGYRPAGKSRMADMMLVIASGQVLPPEKDLESFLAQVEKVRACRRAYRAMCANMSEANAQIRLSERYSVPTSVIAQWVK